VVRARGAQIRIALRAGGGGHTAKATRHPGEPAIHDFVSFRGVRCVALGCSATSAILAFVRQSKPADDRGPLTIEVFFVAMSFASDYIWPFVAEAFRIGRLGWPMACSLAASWC
jgi:hypothetical protein